MKHKPPFSNGGALTESDALAAFEHLEKIYNACGKCERLVLDNFPGEHEIDLEPGIAFLAEQLKK